MKLTDKSSEVFNYIKENGGRVSVEEICKATSRESRSINANVNDLVKKGLTERDKQPVEGSDKPMTYVVLTEEGKAFVPTEDAE